MNSRWFHLPLAMRLTINNAIKGEDKIVLSVKRVTAATSSQLITKADNPIVPTYKHTTVCTMVPLTLRTATIPTLTLKLRVLSLRK